MYTLYSILLVLWGILFIPASIYKSIRRKVVLPGLMQRLGRLPHNLRFDGRSTIWFHACSVGETLSLQSLVHILRERFPDARMVFSTVTATGQEVARQKFAAHGKANTFYFPLDFASVVAKVLDHIRPAMVVIVDTEIWPNLLRQASLRGIPVMLVNGRISAKSFRSYRWARPFLKRVFSNYRALLMQSNEDASRIARIGAPLEKIFITGNLKMDHAAPDAASERDLLRTLDAAFGLSRLQAPVIVAGSTHRGEERILFETLRRVRHHHGLEQTRLLIAPRHPERFDEVARSAEQAGFKIRRRSRPEEDSSGAEIFLLDTIGELATAYRFATIAFVGGSLVQNGGHSLMEPAACGKAIVVGPSMENFQQAVEEFLLHRAIHQITAPPDNPELQTQQLLDVFVRLMQNAEERQAMGKAAGAIIAANRGTAQRIADRISAVFEEVSNK